MSINLALCRIEVVTPEHLQQWWLRFVRRGIETIMRKTQPDWIPEDVYTKVACGQAAIYILHYDTLPVGFIVAMIQPRMYGAKKDLVVWCGWSLPLGELQQMGICPREAVELEDRLMEHAHTVAAGAKCESVLIYSRRPGMKRRVVKWGYTVGLVRYDLKVGT